MKLSQLKAGALLSYLQMGLGILIGVVYTPIMIRLLGQSEYGLYNTVASTISMLSLLKWGFNASYIRFYSVYSKEENPKNVYRLNGLFLIIFSVIGVIAFLGGLFLANNLKLIFDEGFTESEYATAKTLMLLLTVNLTLSFPMSVFSNIISAHERFIFLKGLGIITTVLSPLLNLPLLLAGYRSVAMVTVTVALSTLTDILYLVYVVVVLKNKFYFTKFEKNLFKSIFVFSWFIVLHTAVDQVNWNIGKFLLGRYQGTVAVAIYSVGYFIYQYFMQFSLAISGVFTPRIHSVVHAFDDPREQRREITGLFARVGRVQFLILALLASGIIFFGQPFIHFWAGKGYEQSYLVAVVLVASAFIHLIQNMGLEIQRALNRHRFVSYLYVVMAIVNLLISIYACQRFGVIGAVIGTAVFMIVANGVIMNTYYHKKCNINIIEFWKEIFRLSKGLLVPILCGVAVMCFVNIDSLVKLIVGIVVYTIIYIVSMWLFGMNEYEKDLFRKPLKAIVGKVKK